MLFDVPLVRVLEEEHRIDGSVYLQVGVLDEPSLVLYWQLTLSETETEGRPNFILAKARINSRKLPRVPYSRYQYEVHFLSRVVDTDSVNTISAKFHMFDTRKPKFGPVLKSKWLTTSIHQMLIEGLGKAEEFLFTPMERLARRLT